MTLLAARSPSLPPSRLAMVAEPIRAIGNGAALVLAWPRLLKAPQGDGRPVMVLPGIINSDGANFALRRLLDRLGYRAHGWALGANLGVRTIGHEAERLIARVEAVHAEAGEPVTLIGISLGGIMARVVARRRPELVREVITISAPFAGPATSTNVWRVFELLTGQRIGDAAVRDFQEEAAGPLPMPSTAIWSRSDGFVNGLICRNQNCHPIEVRSSHCWVQMNPRVLTAVARVLAGRR